MPGSSTAPVSEGKALTVNEIYKQRQSRRRVHHRRGRSADRVSLRPSAGSSSGDATGSGFVIDKDGYILTNAHVVEGASKVQVSFGDDKTVDAEVRRPGHVSTDVALLKVNADDDDLHPLTLGDSLQGRGRRPGRRDRQPVRPRPHRHDRHRQRAPAPARGAERLHDQQRDPDRRRDQPRQLGRPAARQLTASVIGINSQIATGGGGGSVGIGFAIPINTVKKIADQLAERGQGRARLPRRDRRRHLDVDVREPQPADRRGRARPADRRGPAKKAGIKGGDTQVTIGGDQLCCSAAT